MKKNVICRIAALGLLLALLTGCAGGQEPAPSQLPDTPPEQSQSEEPASRPESGGTTAADVPESPATVEPGAAAGPAPEPPPAEEPPAAEDGSYTANATLSGGSGRAAIQSPASLRCAGGQFFATVVWSSPNYDYMKVNDVRYDLISAPGENSAFEIPVAAFDQALPVIADTVAMSEPHEVAYTITFDSASLTKQ